MTGKMRCTLLMHPTDADNLDLSDETTVFLQSSVHRAPVQLEITDAIMPGVVSLPHGFSQKRAGTKLRVAQAYGGVSLNDFIGKTNVDTHQRRG